MKTTDLDIFLTPSELAPLLKLTIQGLYKQLREADVETKLERNGRHRIYPREMRKFVDAKGYEIPKGVIALHIVKGGVGKTTLAHGLASRASAYGFKTLMVDLDQQANLSTSFGVFSRPKEDPTLLDVTTGSLNGEPVRVEDVVVPLTDFLHIIPANLTIANLDLLLITGNENIGTFFEQILEPIRDDYDLVFIDCPPSLSRVTFAAHCYADTILMPVNMDRFSIDGLELTLDHLSSLQKKYGLDPKLSIVINKFDARQKILGNAVIEALTNNYRDYLMESYISISKQIDNSIAANQCIWEAKASKNPALEDINNLLIEMFDLESWGSRRAKRVRQNHLSESFAHV